MNACQTTNRLQKMFPEGVREIDTLLNQMFGGNVIRPLASVWRNALSVWEADNTLYVEVDLPGVKREDVDITFEKGELTISAERKTHSENPVHLHNERTYGKVSRSVTLPDTVDPNTIAAALTDGVLRVIPVAFRGPGVSTGNCATRWSPPLAAARVAFYPH